MYPSASPPKSEIGLRIVGSNTFGRNSKMSSEQTFNLFESDGFLVDTPGYKKVVDFPGRIVGRAIYASDRGNFMITVIDNVVFKISGPPGNLTTAAIFNLNTYTGDVFIDENIASEIAICDGTDLWIYNFLSGAATKAVLPNSPGTTQPMRPGYVTYHDGYFIVPDLRSSAWFLSQQNQGLNWFWSAGSQEVNGAIQTKPDNAVAVLRAPGKGNLIYVFGRNVVEMWYNNGAQLFPYARSTSESIDYGCLSSTTIAAMDNFIAFLGVNEKSGPVIMVSTGSGFTRLSTDGIDFKLADVVFPDRSYGFFYKSDGHTLYQLTFYDPKDNFTLLYDFNTKKFFYLTDELMNHHIAESVAFFNNTYYFVSIDDGSIYELNSKFTTYDYTVPSNFRVNPNTPIVQEIPRMRICNSARQDDTSRFIANSLTFVVEQGVDPFYPASQLFYLTGEDGVVLAQESAEGFIGNFLSQEIVDDPYVPRIDMAISKDGGETFGSYVSKDLNPLGERKNRVVFWKLGASNDFVAKFKFWSKYRVTVSDGVIQARVMGASGR